MAQLIGAVFLVLGLVAGAVLLLAPFGKSPLTEGALMWLTFPAGCVIGQVLLMTGAERARIGAIAQLGGGALLALALAATVAQFLVSGGVLVATGETLSLWYVAAVGFVVGGIAWAVRNRGSAGAAN